MKKHYWLAAGTVRYLDAEANHRSRDVNTLVITATPAVTRRDLEHTQQSMQVRLFKELGLSQAEFAELTVYDVFLLSISSLGHMTEAKFHEGFTESPPLHSDPTTGVN